MKINKIYREDCRDTLSRMPSGFLDMTLTSPPYDDLRKYDGVAFNIEIFKDIAEQLYRVTKQGGVVVWIVADATIDGSETGTSFRQALFFKEVGFNLHDTMIFRGKGMPLNHRRYEPEFEYMFVLSKGSPKTFNPIKIMSAYRGKTKEFMNHQTPEEPKHAARKRHGIFTVSKTRVKGNVWEYNLGLYGNTSDRIAFRHPAIFPERLAADHIASWSNEGDLIYDPFMGSGTTAKMAVLGARNWIGSEISPRYAELAKRRLKPYLKRNALDFS